MPYHTLEVYQKAYRAALDVHKLTLSFPQIEQYAMAQQLRSATKSIPVNIAEGMGKQESAADVRKFIRIALGSCDETRVWLEFAKDLGYIEAAVYQTYDEAYREVGRMLRGVLKRYDASNKGLSSF